MSLMVSNGAKPRHTFDSAEMGAIAHLYRGEVYRSTIWRTRLDNTTNWAIGHRAVDDLFQPAAGHNVKLQMKLLHCNIELTR